MNAPATEGDPDLAGSPSSCPPSGSSSCTSSTSSARSSSCTASRRSRPAPSSRSSGCSARAATPTRRSTASAGSRATTAAGMPRSGLHFDLTVPFARYVLENAGRLAFPFRRYQIQKVWRGERPQEGRFREFTQADIDVVDVGELAPHFEAEMPLVIAEAFRRLPVGEFRIQVNNRKIPEGFFLGHRAHRRRRHAAHRRPARHASGPDKVTEMLLEAGADEEQARLVLALAAIRTRRPRPSSSRCAPSACSTRPSTRASTPSPPSSRAGLEQAPGVLVADLQHRPRARLLHRHGLRDPARRVRVVGLGVLRRPLRLAGHRRPHDLPRRRHLDRADPARAPARQPSAGSRRAAPPRRPCSSPSTTRRAARPPAASRRRCGRAASRARWRPSAAKFGKQIRYADRRGIPFVWFPGAGEGDGDQVKDIRSGEQVDADAATWQCPPRTCARRRHAVASADPAVTARRRAASAARWPRSRRSCRSRSASGVTPWRAGWAQPALLELEQGQGVDDVEVAAPPGAGRVVGDPRPAAASAGWPSRAARRGRGPGAASMKRCAALARRTKRDAQARARRSRR